MNAWLSMHVNSPEMFLLGGFIAILLIDLMLPLEKRGVTFYLSELLLVFLGILFIKEWSLPMASLFDGHYIFDHFAVGFKGILVILTFLVFAYAKQEEAFGEFLSEFYLLSLLALLGAMVLISALSLITLYLGLELVSLPLYALVALKRDSALASEAAMKYFVMGALASAMLLFGFSLMYGLSASIYLPEIAVHMNALMMHNPIFYLALCLVVVSVAFKLGVFPFHMWVPDVYQGAALSVVALLSSIAKFAGFALLMRILFDGLAPLHFAASQLLLILGMLSLIMGNIVALMQKNIKRLLGYSTIANMGIIFITLSLSSSVSAAASSFYLITYAFMSVSLLGLLIAVLPQVENIGELKGLNKKHPFVAALIMIVLLSFAGVPPLLGFDAKLLVVMTLLQQGYLSLAILVIIMSVISAAYYLRVVKNMYFDPTDRPLVFTGKGIGFAVAGINALALLGFGVFPSGLMLMTQHLFV